MQKKTQAQEPQAPQSKIAEAKLSKSAKVYFTRLSAHAGLARSAIIKVKVWGGGGCACVFAQRSQTVSGARGNRWIRTLIKTNAI